MLRIVKILSLAVVLSAINFTANAAGAYYGIKGGLFEVENSSYDKAANIGFIVGADITASSVHSVSLEGEYTTTVIDGDLAGGGEWSINTFGLFAAFRAGGRLYFKGKIGYIDREINYSSGGTSDRNSLAYGLGFGIRRGTTTKLEFEYAVIDDDNTFADINFISVAYLF
ncbi:MAG: porin family protein [Gammaproteobacteria bacterium]|nr:porin family protein [Gammaproteobacteria bacterium]